MDYRTARPKLKNNGLEVNRLTVVGLLVEKAPKICRSKRVGASALSAEHLPDVLCMSIDGMRGNQEIRCFADDKALAVSVSRAVRTKMHSLGLEMVEALVEVKMGGRRVGDHDMVYEIVDCCAALSGYLSVELKCRHLYSEVGKRETRLTLQQECCDSLPWWLEQEKQKYVGRAIVMAIFPEKDGDAFSLYADIRLNSETKWRGLFGWPHSLHNVAPPLQLPPAPREAQAKAQPKAQAKAQPKVRALPKAQSQAQAQARAKAAAEAQLHRFGLQFRRVQGALVAEVKALLLAVGKDDTNAAYWSERARGRHNWSSSELFQEERGYATSNGGVTRRKLGGMQPWFATRPVCVQMLMDWAKRA